MLECKILTVQSEIEALAPDWRELHARIGRTPFSNYDIFAIWWDVIGKTDARRSLHVVAGYEDGKLVAVSPLTVVSRKGMRIMQAAGYQAYNYCDMLAGNDDQAFQIWQAARQSLHYDFADIRDVYPESACYEALLRFARQRDTTDAYALRLQWPSGEDWLTTFLSAHTRNNFRRCTRRLEEKGPVRFEAYHGRMPPPEIIEDMVRQKVAWGIARKRGLFEHPAVISYFHKLLEEKAGDGSLFLGWLSCGDHAIAYSQGFIHQGVLHTVVWTYNPEWSRYSPGHIVLVQSIMWAIDRGLQVVDLRQGESQIKRLHSNEKRKCAEFTFNGSLHGRIIENTYIAARSLMRIARGDPAHAGAED